MNKISLFFILISFTSGCVSSQKTGLTSDSITNLTKMEYQTARSTAADAESKLREKFLGRNFFITTQRHCSARSVEAMEFSLAKFKSDELAVSATPEERIRMLESAAGKIKESIEKEYEKKDFSALSKVKFEDVRVLINYVYIKKSSDYMTRLRNGIPVEYKWDGRGEVFLVFSQGAEKFVINKSFQDLRPWLNEPIDKFLFDSDKPQAESLNCLAKNDPVIKYKLSSKDKKAILENNYYLGMSQTAFMLSLGIPSAINNTTNSGGSSQQWVYGKAYFYFSGGKLRSWQD